MWDFSTFVRFLHTGHEKKYWKFFTYGEISDFSTFFLQRNVEFLHMTNFSPHISYVIYVTNMSHDRWRILLLKQSNRAICSLGGFLLFFSNHESKNILANLKNIIINLSRTWALGFLQNFHSHWVCIYARFKMNPMRQFLVSETFLQPSLKIHFRFPFLLCQYLPPPQLIWMILKMLH